MNKIGIEIKRKIRIRSKIKGTSARPRLSVFRSNKFIYAQLINDDKAETVLGVSEKNLGIFLAKMAISKKIKAVVFDRGSYAYHGRIKQVAQGAREGGLKF